MVKTHAERILDLLSDRFWHSTAEMEKICWRFSVRIYDLKKKGYEFEKMRDPNRKGIELWRLV